jgi:serine/threonine protein kinase
MTMLAEPTTTMVPVPGPNEPTPAEPRWRRRSLIRRSQTFDATVAIGPLRGRTPVVSAPDGPHLTVGTSPLRVSDPVSVDGYRLVSRLGAGGMADVFSAVAPSGRPVAVKLLRAGPGIPETCQREFRLTYAIGADCTAPALGYGTSPAGPYLVTAQLSGYRSATTLVGRALPARRLWRLGATLARILATVHTRGIVHCDVKPSNLLIRGHDIRLIDFGIARYIDEESPDNDTVQCSRGFAAPEQLYAAPAAPAMDIFAWGCLLAYLASGVHPFASHSEREWILRVQSAQPDLYGVPPGLDELIRWTLARDPRDRPSARELETLCHARNHEQPRPAPRTPFKTTAGQPR